MNSHSLPRIATLDCVRGIAILGILLLNISAFGLPKAAYLNPAYLGMPSSRDAWTWALLDLFAQAKFLAMFALLFGAGLQMLLRRGKSWIRARLSWLLLFGLAHAIFLWDGDILLAYGLIGLVCWRMIREAKETFQLLKTGVVLYLIGVAVLLLLGFMAAGRGGAAVREVLEAAGRFRSLAQPRRSALVQPAGHRRAVWLGAGGADAVRRRADAQRLAARQLFLRLLFAAGGVAAAAFGADLQWQVHWDYRWSGFLLQVPRELGAPLQAMGYLALCYGFWPTLSRMRIAHWLTLVGRMALSNYLLQTLICTTLFYRFGLYEQFDRLQLLAFVPLVWLANLAFSALWLRYFEQGPMEWLWRRLTQLAAGEAEPRALK